MATLEEIDKRLVAIDAIALPRIESMLRGIQEALASVPASSDPASAERKTLARVEQKIDLISAKLP